MSFFDYFEPYRKQRCQACNSVLTEFQGLDEGLFFLWRQGFERPVDQFVEEKFKCSQHYRDRQRLPARFSFFSDCQTCDKRHSFEGICEENIWQYILHKEPEWFFRSGAFVEVFGLKIGAAELADRLEAELIVYEEDGLGTFRACHFTIEGQFNVMFNQSDYIRERAKKEQDSKFCPGAIAHVDAFDLLKLGFDYLYWGTLEMLNLSEGDVYAKVGCEEDLKDYARKLLIRSPHV